MKIAVVVGAMATQYIMLVLRVTLHPYVAVLRLFKHPLVAGHMGRHGVTLATSWTYGASAHTALIFVVVCSNWDYALS